MGWPWRCRCSRVIASFTADLPTSRVKRLPFSASLQLTGISCCVFYRQHPQLISFLVLLDEAGDKIVIFLDLPNELLCQVVIFMRPSHVPNLRATCWFMRNLINTDGMYIARGIIKLRYSFFDSTLSPIWYRTVDPDLANTVKTMYHGAHDPNFEKDWPEICPCVICSRRWQMVIKRACIIYDEGKSLRGEISLQQL